MNRRIYLPVSAFLLWLVGFASAADRQTVTIQIVSTVTGTTNQTTGDASPVSIMSLPCGEPVPAETNPQHTPGQPVATCDYVPIGISSSPLRFSRSNAILTMEDGRKYQIVLYCQSLSDCPKLVAGQSYKGLMRKDAVLDSSPADAAKSPIRIDLRPDGKHKTSYTVLYARKV